jgi:ATP-dependent DNA helicase RecG
MDPSAPVERVHGIGPRRAAALAADGIRTAADVLLRLPFRYEDRRAVSPIAALAPGASAYVRGTVELARMRWPGRMRLFECLVADGTGRLRAIWFNQPYLQRALVRGQQVALYGLVERDPRAPRYLTMSAPAHELIRADQPEARDCGRIVPVYERVGVLSSAVLRQILARLVADLPDALPDGLPSEVRARLGLPTLAEALRSVHAPSADLDARALAELAAARSPGHLRLILGELFCFYVGLALRRLPRPKRRTPTLVLDERIRAAIRACLPFRLTAAQRRVAQEIADDLRAASPMRRLLQGDVGSGKTVLALMAMLIVVENGGQAVLMAPTELLAEQHYLTFKRLLAKSGHAIELLAGSVKPTDQDAAIERLAAGEARIAIGTHALLEPRVTFRDLRLAVIDEQHRFGVLQREVLTGKTESMDVLVMTATPIPRTLALTAYGDLDVSLLDELPPGRRPVETLLRGAAQRHEVLDRVRREVAHGHQAYVVFPIVEESEALREVRAAKAGLDEWQKALPSARAALLHGRMPALEREAVMQRFSAGEIDVLVATTVIEVGIDVPNATIVVIEHAERFGLAQLHQLRGRVGRGAAPSVCVLLAHGRLTAEAQARLDAMIETHDGFVIAERDLAIRGPGELLGTRQAGLARLRVADLRRDQDLAERARLETERFIAEQGPERAARWLASAGWAGGEARPRVGERAG